MVFVVKPTLFMLALVLLPPLASAGPLDAPQNLEATLQSGDVILTWDTVDGALGYLVYRDGQLLDESEDPTYTDPTAQSTSTFWVTALLPDGESLPSNPANAACWGFTSGIPPVYVNPEECIGP